MIATTGKRLVFRIFDVGFSLAIESLLEIHEASAGVLDTAAADPGLGLLGLLAFRDEAIYVHDVHALFGLPAPESVHAYLVVAGSDFAWAMPVDRVVGIFADEAFRRGDIPPVLQVGTPLPFAALDLWRGEPLVCFDPAAFEQWLVAA